jgi:hypothetical protein
MRPENEKPAKKTFTPPRVVVYGDIRQITRSVGKNGNADGGTTMDHTKSRP